jgi:hypothetical protein
MKIKLSIYSTILVFALVSFFNASAQEDKSKRPSPPAQVSALVDSITITIDYSQPSLKGRDINKLAPTGEVWRTGANEASWIEISDDVVVEGKPLTKGKYGLFTINNGDKWTIIFNNTWKQWGAYKYESSQDALRIDVSSASSEDITEKFTIEIDENGLVSLKWGRKIIPFQIAKAQ